MTKTLTIKSAGSVMTVMLNRPEAKNAFNETMIAELLEVFGAIGEEIRAVVLTGSGDVFCAGADVNWMRDSAKRSEKDNRRDAAAMEAMLASIDECPAPVIGRINGTALGGGMGLLACCDTAIAVDTARFGYTEVRLGIVPAVISPFSIQKIGARAARRLFLTGEVFDAKHAQKIGLVHDVVPASLLDATIAGVVDSIRTNGPRAVRTAKTLVREVSRQEREAQRQYTIDLIAKVRVSPEGQEGLGAFLEKRKPVWTEES